MTDLQLPPGLRLITPPTKPFLVLETNQTLILDWDIEDKVPLANFHKLRQVILTQLRHPVLANFGT